MLDNLSSLFNTSFIFSGVSSTPPTSSCRSSANVAPISTTAPAVAKAYGIAAKPPAKAPGAAPTPPAAEPTAAPYPAPAEITPPPASKASVLVAIPVIELTINSEITLGFLAIPITTPKNPPPFS